MAGTTINQLNLEVKASAAAATKTLGKLQGELSATKGASQKITNSFKGFSEVMAKAQKVTSSFARTIARIAMYRAIRTLIKAVTSGIREGVQNLVLWEQQFRSVENANHILSELNSNWLLVKNTMGSIAVTILGLILPAVETLTQAFITLVNIVNQFIRALSGETEYAKAVKANYNYAKSLGAVKKQLFGFDELNILNSKNGSGGANIADMFVPEDISGKIKAFAEPIKNTFESIKKNIQDNLNEIMMFVLGPGMIALGAVLLATGNAPVGLGLLVAGLATFAIGLGTKNGMLTTVRDSIAPVMDFVGKSLVAVGLILLCTGNIPLGLGVLVAGLAMHFSAATITEGIVTGKVEEMIKKLTAIVSGAMLAIGAILLFSGVNVPLGIALLLGGALGLASVVPVDWDYIYNKIKEKWEEIKAKGAEIKKAFAGFWEDLRKTVRNWIKDNFPLLSQAIDKLRELLGLGKELNGSNYQTNTSSSGRSFQGGGRFFADGGTPQVGSLFWAGEAGPELVAQVGGKTTVTNQDQFTAGLESANEIVVQAILASANALINAVNNQQTTIELDGEKIAKQLYKPMRIENSRQGAPLIVTQY